MNQPQDKLIQLTQVRQLWEEQLCAFGGGYIPVYGGGDADAAVVLVGEAPGEQETLQRKPFVGKAGQNLNGFLAVLGMGREDIYITNVVKFRPVKVHPIRGSLSNRPPSREEIALCAPLLCQELGIVAPRVVVTLGNVALRALCQDPCAVIGGCHGRPQPMGDWELFALYHPASIIYNRGLADTYQQDLLALRDHLILRGILGASGEGVQP